MWQAVLLIHGGPTGVMLGVSGLELAMSAKDINGEVWEDAFLLFATVRPLPIRRAEQRNDENRLCRSLRQLNTEMLWFESAVSCRPRLRLHFPQQPLVLWSVL